MILKFTVVSEVTLNTCNWRQVNSCNDVRVRCSESIPALAIASEQEVELDFQD